MQALPSACHFRSTVHRSHGVLQRRGESIGSSRKGHEILEPAGVIITMYSSPSQSRLAALAAAIIVILSTITTQINVDAFQIISRRQPHTSSSKIDMSSFQEARLAEQLRFRISQGKQREELAAAAAAEEARTLLALEELSYEQLTDEEGKFMPEAQFMPEAPMMTYQKYLTMQEKRVKVTIRYSASAGLRPFYLTVADKVKSYH